MDSASGDCPTPDIDLRWLLSLVLWVLAACGGGALPSAEVPVPGGGAPPSVDVPARAGAVWGVDGEVLAVAPSADGSVVYLAGNFSLVGPASGGFVGLRRDLAPVSSVPADIVQGTVYASTPDGQGGWYIGGDFSKVGASTRNHIARIRADGRVDPGFDPDSSGPVLALAVANGVVYAAGDFTRIGGQARGWLGAVDAITGQATAWKPSPNSGVFALAVGGSSLYVGGEFTEFDGRLQRRIAAFDLASGTLRDWSPGPAFGFDTGDGAVHVIVAAGDLVYVGGGFGRMGGQPRNGLAAVDRTTGLATSWRPALEGSVKYLAVGADAVYASGFLSIKDQQPTAYAAFDRASGAMLWDPGTGPDAYPGGPILLADDRLYVAGGFSNVGGPGRSLAALDLRTGKASAWTPLIDGYVSTLGIAADLSTLYVGGRLSVVGGVARRNLAAISMTTGAATAWNPQADGPVYALAVTPTGVVLGGGFASVGGQTRSRLALVDADQGTPRDWQAHANGDVLSLAVLGQTVYAGGRFNQLSGQRRNQLGSVALADGQLTSWRPEIDSNEVTHIVAGDGGMYVGGSRSTTDCAGTTRSGRTASIEPGGDGAVRWLKKDFGIPRSLALVKDKVWISIQPDNSVAGGVLWRDAGSGADLGFMKGSLPHAMAAASDNTLIFASGNAVGALEPATGNLLWESALSGARGLVTALATRGPVVYVGGSFRSIGGRVRSGFDAFIPSPGQPASAAAATSLQEQSRQLQGQGLCSVQSGR